MARRGKPEAARTAWTPHVSVLAKRVRPAWVEAAKRSAVGATIAIVVYVLGRPEAAAVVALVSLLVVALAAVSPQAYHALDRFFARASTWVGRVLAYVLLAPVFFLVMTPLRLLLRSGARKRWASGREPDRGTYWTRRDPAPPRLDRPF
jgi:hypothetical protein